MASPYDINFYDQGNALMPPNKRRTGILGFMKALTWPLQWLHTNFFSTYAAGFTGPLWTTSASWLAGDRARDIDRAVYEAQEAIAPHSLAPRLNSSWLKVSDIWIGVDERVLYSPLKLVLTYALNRWFDTTFRQPNGSAEDPVGNPTGTSDIYITNNTTVVNQFVVPTLEINSPVFVPKKELYGGNAVVVTEQALNPYAYTINVPVAIFNALGSTLTERENVVRSFADKYTIAGIQYNIATY